MIKEKDLELMAEELTKLYGVDTAKQLMVANRYNLWAGKDSLAYALGKRSLKFFTLYYLDKLYVGEGKAELSDSHYELMDIITRMYVEDTHDHQNNLLPRGFGKTSVISVPVSIWANLYGYSKHTVIGSSISDTANSFIDTIREGITDNPRITQTWGELLTKEGIDNVTTLELSNESIIQAKSSRSSFRGMNYKTTRINLLILDDYQSEDNTSSREQMDKHWDKFTKNVLPAVEKHNYKIIANGTTQKRNDFYNRLEQLPTWQTYKRPAILEDDIETMFNTGLWGELKEILNSGRDNSIEQVKAFYKANKGSMDYKRVWSYFNPLELALQYYDNPNSFMQEYQLELDSSTRAIIDKVHTLPKEVIGYKGNNKILSIDPAGLGESGDYFAFIVGSYDSDNNKYIQHIKATRFTDFEDYIDYIVRLLKEYKDIDTLLIEKNTYSGSDVSTLKNRIKRDIELYDRKFEIVNEMQKDNKQAKIESIAGQINKGIVRFNADLEDELRTIKGFTHVDLVDHDDIIDAAAELILYIDKINAQPDRTVKVFNKDLLF